MTVPPGMNDLLSRLQGGDQHAFDQLATALASSQDQNARNQGEQIYAQLLKHHPDVAVRYLAAGLSQGGDMRRFCCVYLRKAVKQGDVWESCSVETREAVKQKGMECLAAEHDKPLMRNLADAMSTVAEQTWDSKDKWTGILEAMNKFITAGDPHLAEAALMLFTKLTAWLMADDPVMVNMQRQMYDILLRFLTGAPNDDVRIAACQASTSFIASFEDRTQMRALTSLVPPVVAVVTGLLQKGDEDDAREVLIALNELAEAEPALFKPHFQQHAGVLLEVANNATFDDDTRQSALELLITVVEGKPALIRKDRVLLPKLCTTLLGMLLAIEDTAQWHAAVEEADLDDGQDDLHEYSLQGLDRVAGPITGAHLLGTLWPIIEEWSKSGEWQRRHAALLTIAQVAEGCCKVLLPDPALTALVQICCGAANDEHAIVKWCACQAIGQVCTDLQPKIQNKHHGAIVEALMRLMGPEQEPRVQAHASSAVVNFCEHLDANIMGLYLEQLLQRFQGLLGSHSQLVVEGGLTALSSVTDSAGELFKRYYSSVMPALKSILASAMERKSHRRLCGKALECISLIAMAVGKETFYPDARDFMNVLSTLTSTDLEPDDPILTYVQTAGTRMCKCLGHEFVPLLPTFVPPLLKSAGKKSEFETVDAEDVDDEAEDSQYYTLGDRTLRISTAHSEEKINALNMLSCYAEHLQEHFAPYCNDVATIVEHVVTVPLLNDEEMRGACAALMPPLLDAMQRAAERRTWASATPEAVRALYEQLMRALLKALDIEADNGVLAALYESVDQLVDGADQGLIDATAMAELFKRMDAQLTSLLEARAERGRDADEEEDLEQQEDAAEEEDAALEQIIGAVGALLRRFGDAALPHVEAIAQKSFLGMASEPGRSSEDRWYAMLLISDMVEHAPSSGKYLPQLMPKFLEFATADKADLCNVCCYSLGAVAEKHPQAYPEFHERTLDCLTKIIHATKGKDEWEMVRDNAVTALGKILRFHGALTGGDAGYRLGKLWLDGLPIEEDETEAGGQHALLQHFVSSGDERVLGKGQENLPHIADVFVRVIGRGGELLKDDSVDAFQKFFFEQLLPALQKQGFQLASAAQGLQPADQQRFVTAAAVFGYPL